MFFFFATLNCPEKFLFLAREHLVLTSLITLNNQSSSKLYFYLCVLEHRHYFCYLEIVFFLTSIERRFSALPNHPCPTLSVVFYFYFFKCELWHETIIYHMENQKPLWYYFKDRRAELSSRQISVTMGEVTLG